MTDKVIDIFEYKGEKWVYFETLGGRVRMVKKEVGYDKEIKNYKEN